MRCIYLTRFSLSDQGWTIESCTAHDRPYSPSIQELRTLCMSGETSVCPIYRKKTVFTELMNPAAEVAVAH